MNDRIAKQKLNIILLVDSSKSMCGNRIKQVDMAINDIKDYLVNLQNENANVDFYLSIITFSNDAKFYKDVPFININDFSYDGIKCGGYSNLHCAYEKLGEILTKESKGGIMPDFGGAAPVILLLTDGHPTGNSYKDELEKIKNKPWYKVALRYGIAIELDDKRTGSVLKDFVENNGDVINCYDSSMLKNIIKIIVLTASKVKSTSANVSYESSTDSQKNIKQMIAEALTDTDGWEW